MIDIIPFTQEQIFIGTAVFFVLFLLFVVLSSKKKHRNPYEQITSILTPTEQRFYKALTAALKGRVIVMSKVRIADILRVRKTIPRKSFWSYFSKISQKHIDFVLVDTKTFATLCVIELDDKSHARPDRIKRDRFVNEIMQQTDLPLYRFPVGRHYDFTKLLQDLNADQSASKNAVKGGTL